MCAPDESLMALQEEHEFPGVGQNRMCKDFNAYKQWAEMHRHVLDI
jgi:hypothetical protein